MELNDMDEPAAGPQGDVGRAAQGRRLFPRRRRQRPYYTPRCIVWGILVDDSQRQCRILDDTVRIIVQVGGVAPDNMEDFRAVRATGFGLDSPLYKPDDDAAAVAAKAAAFTKTWATGIAKL